MSADLMRIASLAGDAHAACKAALRWADATPASTQVREFLAHMAAADAARARECVRYLVGIAAHHRQNGEHQIADAIATYAKDVEGEAYAAEQAAARVQSIARTARETDERRAAHRSLAERIELQRMLTDRVDIIDVYIIPGDRVLEAWRRETHWPNGKITGRLLPTLVELNSEEERLAMQIANKRCEREVRHG